MTGTGGGRGHFNQVNASMQKPLPPPRGRSGLAGLRFWLLFGLLVGAAATPAEAAGRSRGVLARGTRFETPYYIQESGAVGPTVMIVAGVHGNEPAGALAADQVRHWPITRGRVIVLPRANVPALKANRRYTPDEHAELRNLNRNFPAADHLTTARGTPAKEIWQLVKQHRPDWLIDLHEGCDFHRINPKSVGSSIVVHDTPEAKSAASRMLAAVNATISEPKKSFLRLGPPKPGTLARAAGEQLGCHAMILETTLKDQRLPKRARQHRIMLHRLLEHLKMVDRSVTADWITDREEACAPIRVALYRGEGTGGKGPSRLIKTLGDGQNTTITPVGADDLRSGVLEQFDVVIFPGGSGSKQARAIGPHGRNAVRCFVHSGGGYVGICGGAFLACEGFSWGLKILDAKTKSPRWRRGKANVEIELTGKGREILGDRRRRLEIRYHNGPILMPARSHKLPDYFPLAFFRTEVADNGVPKGIMIGSPAVLAARFGRGRVICFSPHPEQSKHLDAVVGRAVHWAAGARGADDPRP